MKVSSKTAVLVALVFVVAFSGIATAEGLGKYKDVDRALADGYGDDEGEIFCIPNMGVHYVDFALVDGDLKVSQPEALVYARTDDGLLLLGVEYLSPSPFTLFGHHAHEIPVEDLYGLHSWKFEKNDNGKYADLHSNVDENCDYVE